MRNICTRPLILSLVALSSHLVTAKLALRLSADSECPMPGYFRDEMDCRKFYRCAEHATGVPGQNVISKVVFNCPQGTIYDETLSSCNHISFVRDVPPGCNTMSPVVGGSNVVDNDNSAAESMMPSTTPSSHPPPPSESEVMPMPPPSSNPDNMSPPLYPLVPPSNIPPLPIIPGDQQNSMMPPSGIPELPIFPGGNPAEQPPLPVIPGVPGNQEQQPAVPIPVLPPSNQEMSPSFPAFPGFPPSGVSGQFPQSMPPAAISVPVMQGGQRQQLQFPSLNIPNNQFMQNTFPYNFNMFPQHPSISLQNFPGVSSGAVAVPVNQLPSQNQQVKPFTPINHDNDKNVQQQENSQIAIAVPVENQDGEKSSNWINPQHFPNMQHSSPSNIISNNNEKNNQPNPSWVVPNNFPTFYAVLGSRTPVLLPGQQVSLSRPTTYVIV